MNNVANDSAVVLVVTDDMTNCVRSNIVLKGAILLYFRVGHSLVTKYVHALCRMEFLPAIRNVVFVSCYSRNYKKCNLHNLLPIFTSSRRPGQIK